MQASLLDALPATHDIITEPVPSRIAIASELERVHIVVTKTTPLGEVTRFALPVQWNKYEAADLLLEVKGVSWQLDEEGKPIAYEDIREICDFYVKTKLREKGYAAD